MSTEGDPQLDRFADERAALRRELADISDGAVSAKDAVPRLAEALLQTGVWSRPIEEHLIAMRYHSMMVRRLAAAISAALVRVHVFAERGSYRWRCPVCPPRPGHRDRRSGPLPTIGSAWDGARAHEGTAIHGLSSGAALDDELGDASRDFTQLDADPLT